jgi:hypothetical protein
MSTGGALTEQELYQLSDAVVGGFLRRYGFERVQEGEYRREAAEGLDRLLIDTDDRKKKFSVFVSYYPSDMEFLNDFLRGEDRGFPVGPYLTQRGVSRRPYVWSYKTHGQAESSLRAAVRAFEEFALPWLSQLRNPSVYAASVDPDALLDVGAAYERAGDLVRARSAYQALYERFQTMLVQFGEPLVMKEAGEQFIYIAEKLGRDKERAARFRAGVGYTRPVQPLAV